MKISKDERDAYVLENHSTKTIKQLSEDTGWSETTIKSIKTRLGLISSARQRELEEYILTHNIRSVDQINNAANKLGCKHDKVRDTMKALGVFDSAEDRAFNSLKKKYSGTFIFGEYKSTKQPIKLQCIQCGMEHYKRPNDLVTYTFVCSCVGGNTYVYLAESTSFIKVGVSMNPQSRGVLSKTGRGGYTNIKSIYKTKSNSVGKISVRLGVYQHLQRRSFVSGIY